jgi:hypothetical protein
MEISDILKVFADTCQLLFGCNKINKLTFSAAGLNDSLEQIIISPELFIKEGELEELNQLGWVILLVNWIAV